MRKIISIVFLSLMLLQAIPVLHFFAAKKAVFYAYIDEEKPEKGVQEKDECKEFLGVASAYPEKQVRKTGFSFTQANNYATPHLEFLTPPPDAC